MNLLVEFGDKLFIFTDDKVAAVFGPVAVHELWLVAHLPIVSDDDAAINFESLSIWIIEEKKKKELTQGGT